MSKITKEKYMINLLNNKFDQKDDETVLPEKNYTEIDQSSGKYDQLIKQSQQLEKVYKFHRSIIHNLSSGLIILGLNGEISFSNKAAQEVLGYEYEDLLEKKFYLLFSDEETGRETTEILTRHKKKYRNKEFEFRKLDGSIIPIGLSTTLLVDDYNEFEGVIIIFKDLTEVKRLKSQIERMDRLALLGELSAGIAHEIRNPLAGIKAAAQLLEESFDKDDERITLFQRIVKEIDKSNRLLKEFFKFARPSKPRPEFINFDSIVDGLFLLIGARLRKQNIKYEIDIDPYIPQVFVDETQIEQVLLNMLLNSMDAMPKGGEIKLKTGIRSLTSFEKDTLDKVFSNNHDLKYLEVEINDSGKGIKEKNMDKIFDPFFTTKADGLGLGLSITTRLLEENLGKIDVEESNEKGTTFILLLPCFYHD